MGSCSACPTNPSQLRLDLVYFKQGTTKKKRSPIFRAVPCSSFLLVSPRLTAPCVWPISSSAGYKHICEKTFAARLVSVGRSFCRSVCRNETQKQHRLPSSVRVPPGVCARWCVSGFCERVPLFVLGRPVCAGCIYTPPIPQGHRPSLVPRRAYLLRAQGEGLLCRWSRVG